MTATDVLVEDDGPVRRIVLNRPEKLNALTPAMEARLRGAVEAAADSPSTRVVVITGAGRGFCAGADVGLPGTEVTAAGPDAPDPASRFVYLFEVPKPIIAAINGPAFGAGLSLSLYCDLRFMSPTATLGTAFVRRGLVAEHGSAWMLRHLVGPMTALELLLQGGAIDAAKAEGLGLVRLLADSDFPAAVARVAHELAAMSSPRAMGVIKRQVYASCGQSLGEANRMAAEEQRAAFESEDFLEGVAAFRERRPPLFSGL